MSANELRPAPAVILVGFMGSGKNAVGAAVASLLGREHVDTDALIEARYGTIGELFRTLGEDGFRRREAEIVCAALDRAIERPAVLSLGGGAPLSASVRERLERHAHVIWLTAPVDELWRRVRGDAEERPLADDEARFRRLFAERQPLYERVATARVENDGTRTPDDVAAAVVAAVMAKQRDSSPENPPAGGSA